MPKTLYLINPRSDRPFYYGCEVFAGRGLQPVAAVADLSTTTVAALAPADFSVRLCDENIAPADLDTPADFVGITGKTGQWGRMHELAREFQKRGRVVLMGGPQASLCPETVGPHCDILVRGELEEIAPKLFADLREGQWRSEYVGGQPDLSLSPVPRWDLYRNDRAGFGTVQTSRGCPFECEFCDVIQYLGRKQRHKPIGHVLRELDDVYRYGYRFIFLSDDNFTVYRSRTKELLAALREWNLRRPNGRVHFMTQLSIDAARDAELLQMCAEAGLTQVFIGIETPNPESLRETKKRQNLRIDLLEHVQRFLDYGITVRAGMIVGFDGDGPDIFQWQYDWAMASPVPIFSTSALVAPAATPLRARLAQAGRLLEGGYDVAIMPWDTNIVPLQMTREQLLDGMRWLCTSLYTPAAFGERMLNYIDRLGTRRDPLASEGYFSSHQDLLRPVDSDALVLVVQLGQMGIGEKKMLTRVMRAMAQKPESSDLVMVQTLQYAQIRYMLEQGGFPIPRAQPPPGRARYAAAAAPSPAA